jgi:nicotinate phosphoribosyltransferase
MQQAVLRHFPDAQSTYKFTHRDAGVYFTRQCYEKFVAAIPRAHTCPYFSYLCP